MIVLDPCGWIAGVGPLFFTVMHKTTQLSLYLIAQGADLSYPSGENVLMWAAMVDNIELLRYLLSSNVKGISSALNDANKIGTLITWDRVAIHQARFILWC